MKRLFYWLAAHAAALFAMLLFAALPGMFFYAYSTLAVVSTIFLVLNLPLIGLVEHGYYSREQMVGHIERLLMNVIWIGLAQLIALLLFNAEGKPVLLIVLHVLNVAISLTFYDLMPNRFMEAMKTLLGR